MLLCGCGPEEKSSAADPAKPAAGSVELPTADTPRVAKLAAVGADEEIDDPRGDGWTTEVFTQAAKKQLKALAKWGAKPEGLEQGALATLVADGFRGSPLRPAALAVVYAQAPVRVLRPQTPGAGEQRADGVEGRGELAEALKALYTFGGKSEKSRVEIKTYRVTGEGGGFVTREFVSVFAAATGASAELTAHWTCRWTDENPPRLREITVDQYEEVEIEIGPGVLLSDCTQSVLGGNPAFAEQLMHGSDHWLRQIPNTIAADEYGHHGVTVGDANGDGLDDVYLCQPAGLPNRLFVQQPDGTARDVSAEAGADWMESTHSALFVDLDNDGDQDLAVATNRALLVMENDGAGKFTLAWQFATAQSILSLSAIDVDNDSLLDLYGCITFPDAREEGV
jgi:hypothetical protein